MQTLLQRIPVDRITAEARDVKLGRMLLAVIAGLLFAVGWLAAKAVLAFLFALRWSMAAVKVGWQEARKPPGGS